MSLRFSLRWSPCTHLDLFKFKLYKEALCSHIWEFPRCSPPPASRLQGPALIPITAAILESTITISHVFLLMIDPYTTHCTLKIQQFLGHQHNRHSTPALKSQHESHIYKCKQCERPQSDLKEAAVQETVQMCTR